MRFVCWVSDNELSAKLGQTAKRWVVSVDQSFVYALVEYVSLPARDKATGVDGDGGYCILVYTLDARYYNRFL
jgi:hypothetical protein